MERASDVHGKAARVLRRAAAGAFVGSVLIAVYVMFGSAPAVRPVMAGVVLVMVAVSAAGVVVATWFPHRLAGTRPAVVVTWVNLGGSAALAHLDGGAGSPLGFVMLSSLPLVAIVMSRHRLGRFAVTTIALYLVVVALGDPPPRGYVLVHALAFLMLTGVSAHHAESLRGLRRRLARIAAVDPLTGCLNRGAFDRHLAGELARAGRQGDSVSLVLLDLDGFKRINDVRGHGAGDDVLAWTGRALRKSVRRLDVVGRIGGDEFAVLLTGGVAEAARTAEHLRDVLADWAPASVGHATWPADARDAEALRHRADERLYADKAARTGRGHGTDMWAAGGGEQPDARDGATAASQGTLARAGGTVRRSLATIAEDRWRLALVQIGTFGALSCAVALGYVLWSADPGHEPWMVGAPVVGFVTGALAVAFSARLARLRGRRLVVSALNVLNVALVAVMVVGDGGVGSPLVLGILNSIPLVALSAPARVAAPHVGALTATYVALAIGAGADDGWMVYVHLGVYLMVALSYGVHARATTRQWRELRRASRSDALTGCLNRRGFEEGFSSALVRAEQTDVPVSLLVLDLDGFKKVNDTLGHAAGDALLQWVGDRLRATCRAGDVVCRLGGDEFAVVLPDTDEDGAARLAERIGVALAERIPASIGSATRPGGRLTGATRTSDAQALYLRADRSLYAEKARRRGDDRTPAPTSL